MADARTNRFRTALDIMGASRAHKVFGALTQGAGIVFTLHHVRPWDGRSFAPNRLLEITPDFLDTVLTYLAEIKYDVVSLDEAVARLAAPGEQRFASFTFDDGYRDVRDHALPVLRRFNAPSTLFITTSFADGIGDLWWLTLEEAIAKSDELRFAGDVIDARTTDAKNAAWDKIYWQLRAMDETRMREEIAGLAVRAGADASDAAKKLCMGWDELRTVAQDSLVTIGNHTVHHYMLAKHPEAVMRAEIAETQARIARELDITPRHIAYPVGDPTSAGPREFRAAKEMGLCGWTTRLGVLYPEHRDHTNALPRVSLNGHYQTKKYAELFVSGLPFAINNRFRKLNVD
jgi:peptidoglycan/xylan/chitin deacetylase (PgdA/CDA1 family)